ncbi:MAG TPA: hypothetical protein PLN05_09250 [Pyrinomonadaceae bacterium]|nr:hypothetical protein [Chloracidobacterium sp.]HBE82613.1 hypothetical protein [Blastocatellia bacterium]HRJ88458.1 hypothetical protein [Pyrinomonadaceae bacterium]HRK50601.1 hypothetical protein [Pyrinomonadaceae bacterium]
MAVLRVVKKLSHLHEEQKVGRSYIEAGGLRLLRGGITEFTGEHTAGKTSLTLNILSWLTQRGEVCAAIDLNDALDPYSAAANGVVLENLLWVRCGGGVEHALTAADYVLQAKGFGMVWLNLGGIPHKELNLIPKTYWYRFRTKIRDSQTMLVVTGNRSLVSSAADQAFYFDTYQVVWKGMGRFKLLGELQVNMNTRKPFIVRPEFRKIEAEYADE